MQCIYFVIREKKNGKDYLKKKDKLNFKCFFFIFILLIELKNIVDA